LGAPDADIAWGIGEGGDFFGEALFFYEVAVEPRADAFSCEHCQDVEGWCIGVVECWDFVEESNAG
jgi:hypothetical protein